MNRRDYLKKQSLASIGLLFTSNLCANQKEDFSLDQLMGIATFDGISTPEVQLLRKAFEAYTQMQKAALKEGISIESVSSYRSFARQKAIFERKYVRFTQNDGLSPQAAFEKIIEYSTIPGTSRHHWGTEIDIIDSSKPRIGDVLVEEKFHNNGPYVKLKKWMDVNAKNYGFYLVYTNDINRKGFNYEPWHYSFKELSKPMLDNYLSYDLKSVLRKANFKGADLLSEDLIERYIQEHIKDINPELRS
ncbi:MAG: D-alanyl-D-alanine carboxypeptidase [Flavobacteriaceae bacterium]|nr:D-alanyl-D-alanine carboxypeptidase [Flavobacteriaceae bacterium]OUX39086.1 MAG: hypothetical protein CBE25_05395 [Flavobacteriaceae bacterium TMED265]